MENENEIRETILKLYDALGEVPDNSFYREVNKIAKKLGVSRTFVGDTIFFRTTGKKESFLSSRLNPEEAEG
ncbi:hypothetical protein [Leptospira interrogans]|uniref:hypothetical protein n=1 Tax=Leptospira interrogans TaxID=173 RepID=UPI0002BA5B01|nr:hypothetical protein [Leptospira interrogans]QOI36796.1 hypothetical protein LeptoLang_21655 [Leptospira interrogans serovar Icterohaemorrhagiae]